MLWFSCFWGFLCVSFVLGLLGGVVSVRGGGGGGGGGNVKSSPKSVYRIQLWYGDSVTPLLAGLILCALCKFDTVLCVIYFLL